MKPNCLTRALDQWNEDNSMRLWYNGNHILSMEKLFVIKAIEKGWYNPTGDFYKPLESFGTYHFVVKYQPSKKYLKLLGDYFNAQNPNIDIR